MNEYTDHPNNDHDSDVCPWCQAVSYINGNHTLTAHNIRRHPDPAGFAIDVAHALHIAGGMDADDVFVRLTNLLDQ